VNRGFDLPGIARKALIERGFVPDFPRPVLREVERLQRGAPLLPRDVAGLADLRDVPWCSIDNDESLDLDQLTAATPLPGDGALIMVAVADVDSRVVRGSALDRRAASSTTSIYTPAGVFPMIPEALSHGLTSLNQDQDRLAVVVEMEVDGGGVLGPSTIGRALVRNTAKLTYDGVAAWLGGEAPPPPLAGRPDLRENLLLQDRMATKLRSRRHHLGALALETPEARPVFREGVLADLVLHRPNRATQLIEDFMIAANRSVALFLEGAGYPSLRRVLPPPERWPQLVLLAAGEGSHLPSEPDPVALQSFLLGMRRARPETFPDLSLAVVKLMGRGRYAVDVPGRRSPPGHFGLAVADYTHSTAPNRRYPDLITQRILKAALERKPSPYPVPELEGLAARCTAREDEAAKVERRVLKSAAALLLLPRVGQVFQAIVTGAAAKGTWARLDAPPVEGRVVSGEGALAVGQRISVRLEGVDPRRGFIDLAAVGSPTP
jgi:exoribonuclease-2